MRLIDADALINRIKKDPLYPLVERYGVTGVIEAEPTVDAEPVRRGHWIDFEYSHESQCSMCGHEWNWLNNDMETFNYCPNCGAKMDEEGEGGE